MPSRLAYVGAKGDRIELDGCDVRVGTALGVRGRSWSYSLGRRGISNQARVAREATLTAEFTSLAAAERARRVMDSDVGAGTPGVLATPNGWSQRSYVVAQDPTDRFGGWMKADMTVLLLDGVWRKLVTSQFGRGRGSGYGKAYPYGYPFDYAPPGNANTLHVDAPAPCPVRLVVYGFAHNPALQIGGNVYAFDVDVPSGGYLVADTRPDPSVLLVDSAGRSTDVFASAHRGAGAGSGEYAFEPVKPGVSVVGWDGSFGFDVGVYLEEGEMPWT